MLKVLQTRIFPSSQPSDLCVNNNVGVVYQLLVSLHKRRRKLKGVSAKKNLMPYGVRGGTIQPHCSKQLPVLCSRIFTHTVVDNSPLLQETNIYSPPHSKSRGLRLLSATSGSFISHRALLRLPSSPLKEKNKDFLQR